MILFSNFSITLRKNIPITEENNILFSVFSVTIKNLTKTKDENTIFNQFSVTLGSDEMVEANRDEIGMITNKK
jgi:hypothetical protein